MRRHLIQPEISFKPSDEQGKCITQTDESQSLKHSMPAGFFPAVQKYLLSLRQWNRKKEGYA